MHLPLQHQARLAGSFDDENEELHAQLQANSVSHSHSHHSQEDDVSQSQGSKGSGGDTTPNGTTKPKDLPCPRCQSMNTKFCYYNNYSVTHPRHFCRNCQRYWTVGGTLRNVPVGGGSRVKHSRPRNRTDPYYRPGANPSNESDAETDQSGISLHPYLAHAMAGMVPPDMAGLLPDAGFPDYPDPAEFPFHPSQISNLLQLALLQNPSMYGMPFPVGNPERDEAETLQAMYEAQAAPNSGNLLAVAAAMMLMPDLDPSTMSLLHKATLWAEAQRAQAMSRRQTTQHAAQAASAWAEERECKPSVSAQMHREIVAREELRHRQQVAGMHRRPGFWETALWYSRPNKRPAWDEASPSPKPAQQGSTRTLDEEAGNTANASSFSHGYDDTSSWGSVGLNAGQDLFFS